MSEINANIVISPIDLGVVVNTNQLTFTPDAVSLNIYAGGVGTSNSLTANIANVHIYGGTNGYVLQTDGTGNLTWTAQTGNGGGNGTPGGSNTQVQYNNAGNFGGTAGFTFDSVTTNLNVPGNVTAPYFIGNASFATFAAAATTAATVTTNAQPNITSVGTLTSLSVTGNISSGNANLGNLAISNFFSGNGSLLTAINGANVSGQVSNSLIAGTVYTNAQPNITSVGTLTSLSVTGNISSGNANLGNLAISNFFSGDGSLLTGINGANVSNVANANYANYAGNVVNGNSNISIPVAAGNINFSVNGNANIVIVDQVGRIYANFINATSTVTGNNIVGNRFLNGTAGIFVPANGNLTFQANGTNSMTITNSNVTARQFISNVAIGNAPFVVTSTTVVANLRADKANLADQATPLTIDWVIIGSNASANTSLYSIAIGANAFAGAYRAVSIGYQSGTNVANTYDVISIGWKAGRLAASNVIAIGAGSGNVANSYSISIGQDAGPYSGANTISIGYQAGFATGGSPGPANTIAIGALAGNSNIHANSIILNATGVDLSSTQANSLFVKPIRDVTGNVDFTKTLKYNPTTGEIGYV